jgi:hypothetical protein
MENESGKITKCCCEACKEKTRERWIENGWKLLEKVDGME